MITPDATLGIRRLIAPLWPGGTLKLVERRPSSENASLTFSQFRLTNGARSILITYGINAQGKADTLFFESDKEYRSQ